MKIRIGLIGEDPNDTKAIEHLMKQRFDFLYKTLSRNHRGSKMFNDSAVKSYNLELSTATYNCIVVIVDADALISQADKIEQKKTLYKDLSKKLNCKSLLLLNIFELEALILADIEGFNTYYNTKVKFSGHVSYQENAKEHLKKESGKYKESDCPDLFKLLNFDTIKNNCAYFKTFIDDFEKANK